MKYLILTLLLVSILSCTSENKRTINEEKSIDITDNKKITIKGKAKNKKVGAVLYSDDGVYYMYGLDSWSEDIVEKRAIVSGYLTTDTIPPRNKDIIEQTDAIDVEYVKYIIKDYKWKLDSIQ